MFITNLFLFIYFFEMSGQGKLYSKRCDQKRNESNFLPWYQDHSKGRKNSFLNKQFGNGYISTSKRMKLDPNFLPNSRGS